MDIYEEICNLRRQGRRSALATIVNVRGSIPSVAAAKMLVRDDGSILGTVGGGCVENDVCKWAMEVMKDEKPRTFTFNLNQQPDDDTGLVCGGSLQVFVEAVIPAPSSRSRPPESLPNSTTLRMSRMAPIREFHQPRRRMGTSTARPGTARSPSCTKSQLRAFSR